jgi:hypothetical protein
LNQFVPGSATNPALQKAEQPADKPANCARLRQPICPLGMKSATIMVFHFSAQVSWYLAEK